jgi:putative ABC transport system permease protein
VTDWLGSVLPADLYARSAASAAASDQATLPDGFVAAVAALPGVARVQATRVLTLPIDPKQPALALMARPMDESAHNLALIGTALPPVPGELGVFVSEPASAIHGWTTGMLIRLPLPGGERTARVRGIWRDYARQFGAVAIDLADYQRITGDLRLNDLSIWLKPGAAVAEVEAALRRLAGPEHPMDSASTAELRRVSLAIFDRSFAVTRYLQVVAIAVGLVGVAASLSAQVLARRKEFGLLAHLGFTRRQVLALVTLESLAWLAAGCLVGVALGLAIAVVLVHVVNPQSFHWTMPMQVPAWRLLALAGSVLVAGGATAAFSARQAASRQAVQAVKEDW